MRGWSHQKRNGKRQAAPLECEISNCEAIHEGYYTQPDLRGRCAAITSLVYFCGLGRKVLLHASAHGNVAELLTVKE
jgi:hypothetical protein